MEELLHYPAVQFHQVPAKKSVRAVSAIRVVSILSPSLREGDSSQKEKEEESVRAAHQQLLQAIAVWPAETRISLNIVSRPQRNFPLGGRVELWVLLEVENQDKEIATVELLNRHAMLLALLRTYVQAVEFESVRMEKDLAWLESPFAPWSVAGVVHKGQRFVMQATDNEGRRSRMKTIGFLALGQPREGEEERAVIEHVRPWVLSFARDYSTVCEALLWYQAPIWIQIRLAPCRGGDDLYRQPLYNAVSQCEDLLAGKNSPEGLLFLQAKGLRALLTRRLQELEEPAFRVGVFVASTTPMDPAVIASVQHAIAPCVAVENDEDLFQGSSAIREISCQDFVNPDYFPSEDLFPPAEAACAFRFPHPESAAIPGLPMKDYRTVFANPQGLKSEQRELLLLGKNCHRGHSHDARVSDDDRMRHMCILGQTGTGKSTFIENMLVQDIEAGKGCCLLDPHGDLVQAVLNRYPMRRRDDLVLVDFLDHESIIPLNLLYWECPDDRDIIIDDLFNWMDMAYSLKDTGGPIFEQYFRAFMRVLMGENQNDTFTPTITDFCRIFTDKQFRNFCMRAITDPNVHAMIKQANNATGEASLNAIAPYVTSKLNRFELDANLRLMTGQEQMTLDFKEIMDTGKVMLVNLGRGKFGETVSSLLASQIVGRFKTEAMRRIGTPANTRRDFFLYVDEFQNIASKSFMSLLSEARKYRLGLVLANQYADQLKRRDSGGDNMLSAILGNVATTVSFRVGTNDAELLESVFAPTFNRRDLINLPACGHCYVNMKIGSDKPISMSMQTINPTGKANHESLAKILRDSSNKKYAISRQEAEANLVERRKRIEKLTGD